MSGSEDWLIPRIKIKPPQGLQMSAENFYQTACWVCFKFLDKVHPSPSEFSTELFRIILNLWLCACLWLCFGNSLCQIKWEVPLVSGSRPWLPQSCGWWSVPVEGSWGREEAAGTSLVGPMALRTESLRLLQLGRKETDRATILLASFKE